MSTAEHGPGPPHFPIISRDGSSAPSSGFAPPSEDQSRNGIASELGTLLIRGAECMTAALLECTVDAGLNEARYRVLDSLQRRTRGECSQAELAVQLLQSESNLSTLLERMSGDGLITRTRSQTDRRRSLIRMTPLGIEAMSQANRARAATIARLLRYFSQPEVAQLAEGLQRLVGDLENSPEVCARHACGLEPALASSRVARQPAPTNAGLRASHNDRS